jgi:hypothetical protein
MQNCFVLSDSPYKENRRHSLPDSKLLIGNYLALEEITPSTQKCHGTPRREFHENWLRLKEAARHRLRVAQLGL